MHSARWLRVCRWLHILLVFGYVLVTIMIAIVWMVVVGIRMANWARWLMVVGWFGVCFGGVVLAEWMGLFVGRGCRKPIRSEEERLSRLMDEVWKRTATGSRDESKREIKPRWSFGRPIGFETKGWSEPEKERVAVPVKDQEMRFFILSAPDSRDRSLGFRTIMISSGTFILASDEELLGILAHELGHLLDGDRIWEAAAFFPGILGLAFKRACRLIRRGFRMNMPGGFLLFVLLSPVLLFLLLFFCMDVVFRGLNGALATVGDFRQDRFAVRCGCGKGLRDWLEKTGLTANVSRIRRLEKML